MATEIAILPLLEGIDLHNPTSAGGKAFQDVLRAVKEQKGLQRLYWGQEKENSTNLRVFIDWDSVEDHVAFTKTSHYETFMTKLGQVVDLSQSQICHVNATPHPPLALSNRVSPVTEILTVYFPSDYSDPDRKKFEDDMDKLLAVVKKQEIYRGSAGGWILEDIPIPNSADKGKAFQSFIGWESVEAFRTFQQTVTFIEVLGLLKGAKDLRGITITFYTGKLEERDN